MKILKENAKWIILIIVLMIIVSGISVYATSTYSASQVTYKTTKNAEIKTVEEALNDLYNNSNTTITSETITGTGSLNYTFQDNFKAACICVYDGYDSESTWSTTCENSEEIFSRNWPADKGYTRYILLQNIKKDDAISASHSGNKYGVVFYIVFIK